MSTTCSRTAGPELFGVSGETGQAVDVVEFLWASLALFDGADEPDTATVHRPIPLALHTVAAARDRILRRLGEAPEGARLDQLLPEESPDTGAATRRALRRRPDWAAAFVAGLELARQGVMAMEQGGDFEPVHVAPA